MALALGAFTVAAGVGVTLTSGGKGGEAASVAADLPDPNAGAISGTDAAGGATPLVTPSASTSPSASPLPSMTAAEAKEKARAQAKAEAEAKERAEKSAAAAKRAERKATRTPVAAPSTQQAPAGPGTGVGGSGGGADQGSGDSPNGPEAQVLALVNKERAAAGCGPVTANPQLTQAADDYSDVMAASGVMSHTGPDGSTMTSRVEAAGYAWSNLGENIARGQADAESVMESWMNSPGHRANILNCSFDELGVGVHMGDGGPWWTQNFGAGR
ncbi:CAP domain-containing protein [Streptomyces sp. NPDC005805]|uniref:CAP domain-containing protein n=1 Tax=Streptomyces sp. NPDC005805 TaxID=3157068 RepID=UPI0033F572AB